MIVVLKVSYESGKFIIIEENFFETLLFFIFSNFQKTVLDNFTTFKFVLRHKKLYDSYSIFGADCLQKLFGFFQVIFWSVVYLKFDNFSKTLLFEFLTFSKSKLFCSFIIFKVNFFMKTTNEWVLRNKIRPFGGMEILTLKTK